MPRNLLLYLQDVRMAGERILTAIQDKTLADYEHEDLLCLAVERLFEIIGEALSQAKDYYASELSTVRSRQQIINFRNRVIHGYFAINDEIVWSIAKVDLPRLLTEIEPLIAQEQAKMSSVGERPV